VPPFLKNRCALRGGTAPNLFLLDPPRLSADIDLNYIASAHRAVALEEKPKLEKALDAAIVYTSDGKRWPQTQDGNARYLR
jgi:hypothetical protein